MSDSPTTVRSEFPLFRLAKTLLTPPDRDDFSPPARGALPPIGTRVRCQRDAPAQGTWSRYAGRVGVVVAINATDREIGVRFTRAHATATWFAPSEVVPIGSGGLHGPRSPATPGLLHPPYRGARRDRLRPLSELRPICTRRPGSPGFQTPRRPRRSDRVFVEGSPLAGDRESSRSGRSPPARRPASRSGCLHPPTAQLGQEARDGALSHP